jgi:hypothetical protein
MNSTPPSPVGCLLHFLGGEALDSARNAVTVRMKGGAVEVTDGPPPETFESRPAHEAMNRLVAERSAAVAREGRRESPEDPWTAQAPHSVPASESISSSWSHRFFVDRGMRTRLNSTCLIGALDRVPA